jgi:hypothetical protein
MESLPPMERRKCVEKLRKKSKSINGAMSIQEILEELPKLTEDQKRRLWNTLDHELSGAPDEESPEVLGAIESDPLAGDQTTTR